MTDALTGFCNRRALAQALERMTHHGVAFGLMHVDLDFFKAVNDTLGHAAGDPVLRKVAEILTSLTRAEDTIARGGGDEFVAVSPNLIEPPLLESIARRIKEALTGPISFEDRNCQISASIGITTSNSYPDGEIARMQHDANKAFCVQTRRAGTGDVSRDRSNNAGPSRSQRAQMNMIDLQWDAGGVVRNHRLLAWFVPAIRAMRRGWFPRLLGHRASAGTVF